MSAVEPASRDRAVAAGLADAKAPPSPSLAAPGEDSPAAAPASELRVPPLAAPDAPDLPFAYTLQRRAERGPDRGERRRWRIAFAIALALHLLLALVLDRVLRVPLPPRDVTIRVTLHEAVEARRAPPPQELPPLEVRAPETPPSPPTRNAPTPAQAPPRPIARTPVAVPPTTATPPLAPVPPAAPPRLYAPDGTLRADLTAPAQRSLDDTRPGDLQERSVTRRRSTVDYTPTTFEHAWAPRDETIVQEFQRRHTVQKTWRTRWGGQISCVWGITSFAFCGWGYAAPDPRGMQRFRVDVPVKKFDPDNVPWMPHFDGAD